MDLYNSITQRKSCRKYLPEPLDAEQLAEIQAALDSFELLDANIPLSYRLTSETKGMFHVKAPHYLVVSGQARRGEQENAGFIGQQLMLWLDSQGLGGVWLGASRDASEVNKKSDIIVIAFGKPDGSAQRTELEFKRKPILEITNSPDDQCVKAVHLAPSGLNLQPWYLEKNADKLYFYRQRLKPPLSFAYKLTRVDMGIALCHFAVACRHFGKPFRFSRGGSAAVKKGYEYYGCADLTE